jgi:predicted amidohydrolase
MRVALYQNNPVFGEVENNVNTVLDRVRDETFDILVLPELFATGYQFTGRGEAAALADPAGEGYTFETLKGLSAARDALIVYGFPEIMQDRLFNSALAVEPEGRFCLYQKTHLFDTEKEIFDPGRTGFSVFTFKDARIGLMICFDWRFPESARKLALLGAQIICHPSNLVLPHCPNSMIVRALENSVFTVTSDRVGVENRTGEELRFIGKSRIIAPDGTILGELGTDEARFMAVEIDPAQADNKKVTPRNDLFEDRRPEFY